MNQLQHRVWHWGYGLPYMGAGGILGILVVLVTLAATPVGAFEPELATLSGGATAVSSVEASNGKMVQFGIAAPATTPTPSLTSTPAPGVTRRFPGDPNPQVSNKAYWGASIDSNGNPSRHEGPTGVSLSIRRTFWPWSDAINLSSNLFTTVQSDVSSNRLPMISIKDPGWAALANGTYDAAFDAFLRKLDGYGKPVWLVVHHEPEGGGGVNAPDDPGGAPAWRAMQSHVRARLTAVHATHIAFMPVLMSYTWNPASARNPDDWWVPGIWDAYIVDHYRDSVSGDMLSSPWPTFVSWAESKHIPFGLGEWGNRGTDAQAATEMQAFWDWSFTNHKDMVVYSYFDSGLNSSTGSWSLTGQPLTKFQDILRSDTRVQRINNL